VSRWSPGDRCRSGSGLQGEAQRPQRSREVTRTAQRGQQRLAEGLHAGGRDAGERRQLEVQRAPARSPASPQLERRRAGRRRTDHLPARLRTEEPDQALAHHRRVVRHTGANRRPGVRGAHRGGRRVRIRAAGRPGIEDALPPGEETWRGRIFMAHNHGTEYQVRIVQEDGTEELSGWMQRAEQVAPALAPIHRPHGTAYWLRARAIRCPDCLERDHDTWECPLTGLPSARYRPHDSGYLLAVGGRDWSEVPPQGRTLFASDTAALYAMVLEIVTTSKRAA
jgi:hypothetical protein